MLTHSIGEHSLRESQDRLLSNYRIRKAKCTRALRLRRCDTKMQKLTHHKQFSRPQEHLRTVSRHMRRGSFTCFTCQSSSRTSSDMQNELDDIPGVPFGYVPVMESSQGSTHNECLSTVSLSPYVDAFFRVTQERPFSPCTGSQPVIGLSLAS